MPIINVLGPGGLVFDKPDLGHVPTDNFSLTK